MKIFGTDSFLRQCGGISTTLMRTLETEGVIRPQRTDTGRRVFSPQDVAAARRAIAARRSEAKS
jgi:DNA-binding transcriptional MerR regulator